MTIFEIPMPPNDAHAETIGDYLRAFLKTLWVKGESFNGERPFGNSGWQYDIYRALIAAKVVDGKLSDNWEVDSLDEEADDKLIVEAIAEFGKTRGNP